MRSPLRDVLVNRRAVLHSAANRAGLPPTMEHVISGMASRGGKAMAALPAPTRSKPRRRTIRHARCRDSQTLTRGLRPLSAAEATSSGPP